MKKLVKVLLAFALIIPVGCSKNESEEEAIYTAGTYTATAKGFGGDIEVTITVSETKITEATVVGDGETPAIGGAALEELGQQIVDANSAEIDGVSGATYTSTGAKEAAAKAIAAAMGEEVASEGGPVSYTAGTYTGEADGYNGKVVLDVTFSEDAITDIQVNSSKETAHVGDVAYDIMFADAIEANGSGIDTVSGATFTSKAIINALNDAAEQAGADNMDNFEANTVEHEAQADIEETYDIVVVGAGGAGMAAAAQATQNGQTVVVIEENAEIGGNTLVSGGQFQSVQDYLVWDPADPDATEAVWDYDGQTYTKCKAVQGQLATLKTILEWSEEPFDEDYFKDNEFVAGEIDLIAPHGVHEEYLQTLKDLKAEIQEYVDWADAKLAAGAEESDLTLFSTNNLHIFQTYYGGLRQSADKSYFIYGDYDLVSQFILDGQSVKTWLEDQGSKFNDAAQITLIGALWYRENVNLGCDIDGDGENEASGNWGTYFLPLKTTVESNEANSIMTRCEAQSLIVEDGAVTGVEATMYDGTKVTLHANNGVVLATGGYAANIEMVVDENEYWDESYLTTGIKTTNRSSLTGDGLEMAEAVDAGTTGLGFAQMMPISWVDNGNLAFGGGQYAVYINPTTGERFVDESAERDVLSLGEFANGIEYNGTKGVFLEFSNADQAIGVPYPYDKYEGSKVVEISHDDVEGRVYYVSSAEEIQAVLDEFGMEADPETIYETIRAYDESYIADEQPSDGIAKQASTNTIGTYNAETGEYKLEGELLRIRVMAPSTHHTMGGLTVDTSRHVLNTDGEIIQGLYAAGEVTGGIHGGNRLGGNAIIEILVSGRTAANTIKEEAE